MPKPANAYSKIPKVVLDNTSANSNGTKYTVALAKVNTTPKVACFFI